MIITVKRISRKKCLSFLADWLILFHLIFEFPLGMGLTTRRIAAFAAIVYLALHKAGVKQMRKIIPEREFLLSVCGFAAVAGIVILNRIYYPLQNGNTYMYVRYLIYIILYVYVAAFYCMARFDSLLQFSNVYVSIMLFQSVCVFAAFFSRDLRMFFYTLTEQQQFPGEKEAVFAGSRICGFQLMAAGGSLILCTGCLLLTCLVINKRIRNTVYLVLYMILCSATMLIGRTGFYAEILLLIFYAVLYRSRNKYAGMVFLGIAALCVAGFLTLYLKGWMLSYYKRWIGEIFIPQRLQQTLQAIVSSGIPPFTIEMIFGTNVLTGTLPNGVSVWNDSGYFRMYCAVGIIGCLFYYGAFLWSYLSIAVRIHIRKNRIFFCLCSAVSFVIEFKEPFFNKYFFAFIVLVTGLGILKEEKRFAVITAAERKDGG